MRKLNWKKIVAGTLSAIMLLSVTACGSSSTKSESASTEAGKKELTKVTFCLDMKSFLKKKGIDESRMISLGIFDYLIPDFDEKKTIPIKERKNSVIIAGNLSREKSEYIYHLPKNVDFDLYGMHYEDEGLDNICYHGAFPANELPLKLNGRFGLVWDGYSANGCQGTFGQYLKLNNPHKTSLYLASGIPVIIWEKAALAPFIVENNLGIAVNDLSEIKDRLLEISDMQYNTMAQNVKKISNKLRNGYYIKAALESIDR